MELFKLILFSGVIALALSSGEDRKYNSVFVINFIE